MELVQRSGRLEIIVEGPIRLGEVDGLYALCLKALEGSEDVGIDLSQAEHLHAASIQCLRSLQRELEATGKRFAVVAASEPAAAALRLCGLAALLPDTEQEN